MDTKDKVGDCSVSEAEFTSLIPVIRRLVEMKIPEQDVDDVLQIALWAAWASRASYRGESSLQTWMMRIAFNKIGSYYRDPWRKRRSPLKPQMMAYGPTEDANLSLYIEQILGRLKEKDRQVLKLVYLDSNRLIDVVSSSDIAYECLRSRVRSALKRARRVALCD